MFLKIQIKESNRKILSYIYRYYDIIIFILNTLLAPWDLFLANAVKLKEMVPPAEYQAPAKQ